RKMTISFRSSRGWRSIGKRNWRGEKQITIGATRCPEGENSWGPREPRSARQGNHQPGGGALPHLPAFFPLREASRNGPENHWNLEGARKPSFGAFGANDLRR